MLPLLWNNQGEIMKIFNGSHSKAMGWAILFMGFILSIILKNIAPFVTAVTVSGGLVANKTIQARKGVS